MISQESDCKIPLFKSSDPRVSVGRFTYGNPLLMLWAEDERLEIGSFCSIAPNVTIFAGGEHNIDWVTTYPLRIAFGDELAGRDGHPSTKGKTKIGNDVWIGYGATILSGVTIGDGSVIGAGAVVVKNVPPYAIVVGNPARVVRYRFDSDTVIKLLEIAWWDWPIEKIQKNISLLCGGDVKAFTKKASIKYSGYVLRKLTVLSTRITRIFRKRWVW